MSENWDADARVGVPMMQVIAKQVSQHKHSPREVRRIIDAQWLDEESKQQLRETFRVTDTDLAAAEREAADQARRLTRERYGNPIPAGPCDCDAEFLVHPSGRIECQNCGADWAADEVRKVIDAQWLDEESKQQLRETFRVTDADLAAKAREAARGHEPATGPEEAEQREAAKESGPADKRETKRGEAADRPEETRGEAADRPEETRGEAADRPEETRGEAADKREETQGEAADKREDAGDPAAAGEHEADNGGAANGRNRAAGQRGKASKREASGPLEATGEREPAKQHETAGQAGTAD
jgi:hypothetical protein